MKIYRAGLPTISDETPEVKPAAKGLPSIELAMQLAQARQSQVLEYTRKPGEPQPLIVNPQPGIVEPHSINEKPEVKT